MTEAAVADYQQNLQLIKNSAPLSLADSRAGLASFEPGCRSLTVKWEVQHADRLTSAAITQQGRLRQDAQLHPKTITCLTAEVTFDRNHTRLHKPGRTIYVA